MELWAILIEDYDGDYTSVTQYVDNSSMSLGITVKIKRYGGKSFSLQGVSPTAASSNDQPSIIEQVRADLEAAQQVKVPVLLVVDLQIVKSWLPDEGLDELWGAESSSVAGETPIIVYTRNKADLRKAKSPLRQIVSKIDRGSRSAEDELNDAVGKWLDFLVKRANEHA